MRRWVIVLVVLLALTCVPGVEAQNNLTFSQVHVDLWPEYDQPDMLVIYRMVLAPEVSLPAQISLRIPRQAGNPYNVAMQEMDGQLYNMTYSTEVDGDWLRVTFTTASRIIQLEYYDPAMTRDGDQRHFVFSWPGDYEVTDMVVQVLQPVNAGQMSITPGTTTPFEGENGLLYHAMQVGKVNRGMSFRLRIDYEKPDDTLTNAGLQPVQPNAPLQSDGLTGNLTLDRFIPFILGAVGLLLLLGGAFWMITNRGRERAPVTSRPRHRASARPVGEDQNVYCSRCGKKAAPGDAFCRACGTRLRGD